jgi:hypothetical protein
MRDTRPVSFALVGVACLAFSGSSYARAKRHGRAAHPAPTEAAPAAAPVGGGGPTSEPDTEGTPATPGAEPTPAASSVPGAEGIPATGPSTFETYVRAAVPMTDLGTLLAPFAGKCDGETRDLDRIRCRTTRAYLRKVIPRRSFWTVVDDPATIAVSEFDAAIKGYHLSVAGCLACTHPVTVGRTREKRMITLKAPEKEAESLRAAVEVTRNSVGFDSLAEAKAWLEHTRPQLRTQFVFQPTDAEWSFGPSRGYALTLLAVRVFNRCTGEILISRPPSSGIADMPGIEEGCPRRDTTADAAEGKESTPGVPTELSKNDISSAMRAIRPEVFACFEKFKVPGLAQFEFVVAGNGTVHRVRLSGAFYGTPTGSCLIQAGQNARFPRFAQERQQFVYPFFLRN